jgi:hypothetical protein
VEPPGEDPVKGLAFDHPLLQKRMTPSGDRSNRNPSAGKPVLGIDEVVHKYLPVGTACAIRGPAG